jgi:hypothetical protein
MVCMRLSGGFVRELRVAIDAHAVGIILEFE